MSSGGPVADEVAELTIVLTALGTVAYVLFLAALIFALRRSGHERTELADDDTPRSGTGTDGAGADLARSLGTRSPWARRYLVYGGLALPTVLIAAVFWATLDTMLDTDLEPGPDALAVDVTGHQWWWEVAYDDGAVSLRDELVIPTGRRIELAIRSEDVIHSFWVPALAGKLDALPDRTNTLVLVADEPGRHPGRCAEFCGLHHADMDLTVTALPPDEFDRWLAGGGGPLAGPGTVEGEGEGEAS